LFVITNGNVFILFELNEMIRLCIIKSKEKKKSGNNTTDSPPDYA